MTFRYSVAEIKDRCDVADVAETYGATFQKRGQTWWSLCVLPDHNEKTPSFTVVPSERRWHCYGCNKGGDVLELVQQIEGWKSKEDFPKAVEHLAKLGNVTGHLSPDEEERIKRAVEHKRKKQLQAAEEQSDEKAKRARKRWLDAGALTEDTPAYRYLKERRGVDLNCLPRWPSSLRFEPAFRWHLGAIGQPDQWVTVPAIMAAMVRQRSIRACHVTTLLPDGSDLDRRFGSKGRLILGVKKGAAVHLHRGSTDLPARAAYEKQGMVDTLAFSEGIEDGLSVALEKPEWRVWVAADLGNIGEVHAPGCAAEVVILGENDASQAARQALRAVIERRLKRDQGRQVSVAMPPPGFKDWNALHERSVA